MHERSLSYGLVRHLAGPLLYVLQQLPLALPDEIEGGM